MADHADQEIAIFGAALQLPAGQRAAYLDEACAGDAALRRRVEAFLAAHAEAGGFLEGPVPGARGLPAAAVSRGQEGTIRLSAASSERAGERIGRYKLLQQIGEGGCGVVYMAEQEEPVRRRVALKVIKLGMDTKSVIARFEAERQALALMDHPNIAKVLDAGATDTGRPYFVMELVKGIPITHYCDENNLSMVTRLELFVQVCRAIQHAHQKGIIHRDIKPSNILVADHDGVPAPKIIDFGIAKATTDQRLTDKTLFTAFEQFIGTPAYMSPEQAEMTSLDIDTRSDIYSLGVLLYELLTGKTPFDTQELLAAGLEAMRRIIREEEPALPSTRLSTMLEADLATVARNRQAEPLRLIHLVRGDLDWIVVKALEKDRTRRYETANALAMEIDRFLKDEPVMAAAPSAGYKLRKLVRRHRGAMVATGLVVLALVGGIAGTTWGLVRALHQKREAERQASIAKHTTDFLTGMFESIDPAAAELREITVREMLDEAGRTIGTAFPNQPLTEWPIRKTMAEMYGKLGHADLALPHAEADLRLTRAGHGEKDDPDVAESLNNLGYYLGALGRRADALPKLEAGLAMRQRIYKGDHPAVAESLDDVATCLDELGRSAEALSRYEAALAMWQRIYKGDHRDVAISLNNVGVCLNDTGRSTEALPKLEAALAMRQRLYKGDHPDVAASLKNVAACLGALGHSDEALSNIEAAVEMEQRIYKGDHPDVAKGLDRVGVCLYSLNRSAEALVKLEAALAMWQRIHKADHPSVAMALNNLAFCLDGLGRPTEANQKYQEAVEMLQRLIKAQPANNLTRISLATTHQSLGYLLAKTGDLDGAREHYRTGLQISEYVLAADAANTRAGKLRLSFRLMLGLDQAEVVVLETVPGSQAQQIGLRKGDIMVRYAGNQITSKEQLTGLVGATKGTEIELEIRREGMARKFALNEGRLGVVLENRTVPGKGGQ